MKLGQGQKFSSRPTPAGITTLVFALLGMVLGRLFGLFEVTIIGFCAFLFPFLAIPINQRLKSVQAKCNVWPNRVPCESNTNLEIELTSNKVSGLVPEIQNLLSADFKSKKILCALEKGKNTINYSISPHTRGIVDIGPIQLRVTDPFNLAASTLQTAASTRLIVHPTTYSLEPPVARGDNQLQERATQANHGTEFHSLKEYQPGDNWRLIHWPSSAKQNSLMLKQNIAETSDSLSICIFLDNRPGTPDQIFEEMVSAAASVAVACEKRGDNVLLQTLDESSSDKILDFLSMVRQIDVGDTFQNSRKANLNSQGEMIENVPLEHFNINSIFNSEFDISIVFLGNLNPRDERIFISNTSELNARRNYNDCQLIFFGDAISTIFPSLHISQADSFQAAWQESRLSGNNRAHIR